MNRNQILETYLGLSRKAQEAEYYFDMGTGIEEEYNKAANAAIEYYSENNITRDELTNYRDSYRNVVKTDNVDDAFAAMQNFFSEKT